MELIYLLKVSLIGGQLVYWLLLCDDGRDQLIWDACLYPGGKEK